MGQRAFLAEMDSELHAAFAGVGMADDALYLRPQPVPDEQPVACRVYVDRDTATFGSIRQAKAQRIELVYVLSPGFAPEQAGTVLVDGDRYENMDLLSNDGSLSRWMARRVAP